MDRTLVMKFGGAAVANAEQFGRIARIILERAKEYRRIAVVVSAMGRTTDELLELARSVHPQPPRREQDMLISVGERVSVALLAMALDRLGKEAISFTGSQSGVITTAEHTEARIVDVRPRRLLKPLEEGKIVLVAGFQGVSVDGEITTLGRGGSDTSAVAIALALGAERVEFYKDVPGICERDPKLDPEAQVLKEIVYEKAIELAKGGAKVLHLRALLLAQKNGLELRVLPFADPEAHGTRILGARTAVPVYELEVCHAT